MSPFLDCWPFKIVKTAAKKTARHHRRIGRHIRRAAGAAVSTPAAIVWTCVVVGWPAPLPPYTEMSPTSPGPQFAGFILPGEFETAAVIPPLFLMPAAMPAAEFAVPDCCSPGPQFPQPQPPETPPEKPTPAPEPGSLAMLGSALAALIAWRMS